jgi:hypothetical protein
MLKLTNLFGSFFTGLILGSCIWAFSPWFTGKSEPWDSSSLYYDGSLAAAGLLAAAVCPRFWWLGAMGIYFGQVGYMELVLLGMLRPGDPAIMPSYLGVAIFGFAPAFIASAAVYVASLLSQRICHGPRPPNR